MTNTPPDHNPIVTPEGTAPQNWSAADSGATAASSTSEGWPPEGSTPTTWPTTESNQDSTADVAKEEAGTVKDTAVAAGQNVAATAKDEAGKVAEETKQQAKTLFGSVTSEVQSQAGTQQQKIASSLQALSKELGGMASGSSESGPLTDWAHQGAQKGGEIAHWLENHEPRDVLREVQSFARRRPVMFLALCGAAGVVAGRLTRGAVAANTSLDSPSSSGGSRRRSLDAGPAYEPASLVEEPEPSVDSSRTTDLSYVPAPGYGAVDPADAGIDPAVTPDVEPSGRPGGLR